MNGETPGVASAMTNLIERREDLVQRLKHLEVAATPGPWCGRLMFEITPEDSDLCDEMRNALPELLVTIDRLERENATYQGVTKALHEEREKNRKLLAVVEAAKHFIDHRNTPTEDYNYNCGMAECKLEDALAALEEKE